MSGLETSNRVLKVLRTPSELSKCSLKFEIKVLQMHPTKTAAYYISPIEIGVLWAKNTYAKSHSKALSFNPQTDTK